jgi:hypothetical protein
MTLGKREATGFERGNIRTYPVENSLWTRLWICHKPDYALNGKKVRWIL